MADEQLETILAMTVADGAGPLFSIPNSTGPNTVGYVFCMAITAAISGTFSLFSR
jgi:hypothetical protein